MGMTIEKAKDILTSEDFAGYSVSEILEARDMTLDIMSKYQKMQADYENRLKADLKAILVELQLEIEENQIIAPQDTFYDKKLDGQFNKGISKASEIIQQKINSLKEA